MTRYKRTGWRRHDLVCTQCNTEHREAIRTKDMIGGLKIMCPKCDAPTVHRYPRKLAGDLPRLTHCVGCGTWTGKPEQGDPPTCRACAANETLNRESV